MRDEDSDWFLNRKMTSYQKMTWCRQPPCAASLTLYILLFDEKRRKFEPKRLILMNEIFPTFFLT